MDDQLKKDIELEVRRVLATQEVERRQSIIAELNSHRNYLQSQIKWLGGIVTAIFLIIIGAVYFFTGRSYDDIKDKIGQEVESKVIEFRIVDVYEQKLNTRFNAIVTGDKITKRITDAVSPVVDKIIKTKVEGIVIKQVHKEVTEIGGEGLKKLLERPYVTKADLKKELEEFKKNIQVILIREPLTPISGPQVQFRMK